MSIQVESKALAGNLLKVPTSQRVEVYVPAAAGSSPLPTLYLLHGIGGTSADWTQQGPTVKVVLDRLIEHKLLPPMLVVMPTAMTPYGGSMYVKSPLSGDWETFLSVEVVSAVEDAFAVVRSAAGRVIAGHSMGGYGAIVLAARHPEVFGAVYAMSPCCLSLEGDLSAANEVWSQLTDATLPSLVAQAKRGNVYPISMIALAAAFSPNPQRPPLFVDLPFTSTNGRISPQEPAYSQWTRAMIVGNLPSPANLRRLRGIALDYGIRDQFSHIRIGTQRLSGELASLEIPHSLDVFDGDHRDRLWSRLENQVLPLIGRWVSTPSR
ncbi:MAG TPA: alpha/beta fold hydrolase [Vicinamibacterales bacterium]|nr:alpha/beta fold hydrolase [Vicinamibacterales bacterium]